MILAEIDFFLDFISYLSEACAADAPKCCCCCCPNDDDDDDELSISDDDDYVVVVVVVGDSFR